MKSMGHIKNQNARGMSTKEPTRIQKQERKKWKAERLLKKIEKEKLKEAVTQEHKDEVLKELSTISIALPGSILENAQSPELRTYLAGQIARAACIFQVDEIVIFDDKFTQDNKEVSRGSRQSCIQLGRILQYLECPQYLRKNFFPIHKDLQYAGILNPLDAPHHLREHNNFMFREGIVTNKPTKNGKGSKVNIGLKNDVQVDKLLTTGLRCTVKLEPQIEGSKQLKGIVVAPTIPRKTTGVYWGYNVRIAETLSQVFSQSPYKEGYDVSIGTSDKGDSIDTMENQAYNHLLIVFGGLDGLEATLEADEALNAEDPFLLFDCYLNTVPDQGSRTIRTEEAILVTMAALRSKLIAKEKPMLFEHISSIAQSSE